MSAPRRDTRGIVNAADLLNHVRFRRHEPAADLRPYLEHYWLIDWDLPRPYATHVVPHPCVNIVFQHYAGQQPFCEVAGVGLDLFTQELAATGRVCGIQFRPGGFRPFAPHAPAAEWTGRRLAPPAVFDEPAHAPALTTALHAVLTPEDDRARVAALDAFLRGLGPHGRGPEADPQATLATDLVDLIRRDRSIRRVGDFARDQDMPVRTMQRLFAAYVGVGPKWVILRYRIHEALERAEDERAVDWAGLAADLGYADQAHLVRDFTATVGVPPTAHAAR
ncbi:DUF6597 domain-containing transcriptional factor [Streptomyces sp. NPDC059578]|uniref:DUF6597 domain-containing transcriptional factor n=1 Tax=unclassified Streptomyces TaxID=2593676 RepID=UPI003649F196